MGLEGSMWAPANRAKLAAAQKAAGVPNAPTEPAAARKSIPTGPRGGNRGHNSSSNNNSNHHHHDHHDHQPQLQLHNHQPVPQITHTPPPPAPLPHPTTPADALTITPAVPSPSPSARRAAADAPPPSQELDRYTHIIARLNWKIPSLDHGYFQAAESIRRFQARECSIHEVRHQVAMFKLDFFEFYMLIERALVRILGVFGVAVTGERRRTAAGRSSSADARSSEDKSLDAAATTTSTSLFSSKLAYAHAYHQNVIDALDDPTLPLFPVLGSEAVNGCLQRAKDLRNLWKYAHIDDVADDASTGPDDVPADAFSLDQYELRNVLETVIGALAAAKEVGHQRVQEMIAAGETTPAPAVTWDFMTDAMDWEAI